jgi:sialate O-acetylesterase
VRPIALALCLAAALPLAAQTILMNQGPASYQVYQRDDRGFATISIGGKAFNVEGKKVEARVSRDGAPLAGMDWKSVSVVKQRAWSAVLKDIPTGGPYRIEVRVEGTRNLSSADNVLVGDLWILAGQSNMEGVGNLENLPESSPLVNSFDQTDRWKPAKDPLHSLPDAVDRVHWRKNASGQPARMEGEAAANFAAQRKKGAGLGLPFALEMLKRTGVPIGLVPCAHGGTSMDQWSPALRDQGGDSLYGATLRRFREVGGKVTGILWYQGESDANAKDAPVFPEKFKALVAAFRADFQQPDLPFYYVQIGRFVNASSGKEWNQIQESQRLAENTIPHSGMATCIDCRLDDIIHVGTDDLQLLGVRMANLACHDLFADKAGCGSLRRGPRPVSARFSDGIVTVEFTEVNGRLTHAGNLTGFSLHDAQGQPLALIYRQRLSASSPNKVELLVSGKLDPAVVLQYGAGRNPYVNLRDDVGMAAPAFGPMPIEQ